MLAAVVSTLAVPLPAGNKQSLAPKKETVALDKTDLASLKYWLNRTTEDGKLKEALFIPSAAHVEKMRTEHAAVKYDPVLYPGTVCEAWCSGDVAIDADVAEERGRSTFPEDMIAPWDEKCSWDKFCSGCPECAETRCASYCDTLLDIEAVADWKAHTLTTDVVCSWGSCHGCEKDCGKPTSVCASGGNVYKAYPEKMNWTDAQAACKADGMMLAVPRSEADNNQIRALADGINRHVIWIGITDMHTEGLWLDGYGRHLAWSAWLSTEPNDVAGEDCGTLVSADVHNEAHDARWNDIECGVNNKGANKGTMNLFSFVCETPCETP